MKPSRLTPKKIINMIKNGEPIPKSKTWHRFQNFMQKEKDLKGKMTKQSACRYALEVDIPLGSMMKFMDGTYVISPTNIKKIQAYLDEQEKELCTL